MENRSIWDTVLAALECVNNEGEEGFVVLRRKNDYIAAHCGACLRKYGGGAREIGEVRLGLVP